MLGQDALVWLSVWLLAPTFWLSLGLILVTLDLFVFALGAFLLDIGAAALLTSLTLFLSHKGWLPDFLTLDRLNHVLVVFAVCVVCCLLLIRFGLRRKLKGKAPPDVNRY